jgi:hypothetical protein
MLTSHKNGSLLRKLAYHIHLYVLRTSTVEGMAKFGAHFTMGIIGQLPLCLISEIPRTWYVYVSIYCIADNFNAR